VTVPTFLAIARPALDSRAPAGREVSRSPKAGARRRRGVAVSSWAIGALSALLAWQGWQALASSPDGPRHAITAEGMVLVGPAVLAVVAFALLAERLWPAVPRPLNSVGHRQDALYLAVYVLVAVPVVTLLGTGFAVTVLRLAPWISRHPFAGFPRWTLVLLAVLLTDACNWVAHYLNHRLGTFWRYHALHHSQEEMSILTAFRAHPLVHASFQVAALPIFLLGTAGEIPLAVLVVYIVLSTLPHANVRWSFGPLGHLLVSPSYHRMHHDEADLRGVNLGTVFVIWDLLAGLAVFPTKGSAPVATGLRGRPVPVEQSPDAGSCFEVLVRQLFDPLWKPTQQPLPEEARR
jgi:sterol desaturase/sphingolipid hydroxylase (fatty acid hydroxylase superfamily)